MRSDVLPVERQQAQRQLQILVGDNYFYSSFYRKYSLHHSIGHSVNFIVPCLRNLLTAEATERAEFFDEIRFTKYECATNHELAGPLDGIPRLCGDTGVISRQFHFLFHSTGLLLRLVSGC